jgi:hypothetical protein
VTSRVASSSLDFMPCFSGGCEAFLKNANLLVETFVVGDELRRLVRFCVCEKGRCVKLSEEFEALEALHMSVDSTSESGRSLDEDGTKVILTGSDDPSNQLDNLVFLPVGVNVPDDSLEFFASTSNSAASFGDTRSGEIDRSRVCFRKGKKPEDLGGSLGASSVNKGGRSTAVRDR